MRKESFRTRVFRYGINLYPMFFGTGGKVLFIAEDWHYVKVQLGLNLWTRNYVGTIFGGSQFAASDPMFMVMLANILGKDYVVWDKAANIQFKKPGKGKLYSDFEFTAEEIEQIKKVARAEGKYEFQKSSRWIDSSGEATSVLDRTLYVATKEYYRARKEQKESTRPRP